MINTVMLAVGVAALAVMGFGGSTLWAIYRAELPFTSADYLLLLIILLTIREAIKSFIDDVKADRVTDSSEKGNGG